MAIRVAKQSTKSGNKYFFDTYYDDNGIRKRYRSKLYAKKEDAKKRERQFLSGTRKQKNYTFNELIDNYILIKGKNWKKATFDKNEDIFNHIRYKLGSIPISRLTNAHYEAFLNYLDNLVRVRKQGSRLVKTSYSSGYKNRIVSTVKALCEFADIHYNVRTKIPHQYDSWKSNKKQSQVLTLEQFNQFIQHVEEPYKSFFTFLMFTGCRRGERLRLTFDDIDFNNKTVSITKSFSKIENRPTETKTKSSIRTLPLSKQAYNSVKTMQETYHSGYVFGGKSPLPFSNIERKKNKALRLANLPRIRVHDFRHSFITMMIVNGADIATVSHYVGHASVKQTLDTYTHYYDDKMKELIAQL